MVAVFLLKKLNFVSKYDKMAYGKVYQYSQPVFLLPRGCAAGRPDRSLRLRGKGERKRMKERSKKRRISTILLTVVLVIGMGLLIYPPFSEYWNSFHQSRAIVNYAETVSEIDSDVYEELWQAALDYNARLAETGEP